MTKLDVLDSLPTIKICTAYRFRGEIKQSPPLDTEGYAECEPVYEELPGWQESTLGIRSYHKLPANAQAYLKHIEKLLAVPIDIISTGADRDQTIVLRHPFD
jgi:adenylosuccinate synthase